MLGSHSEADDAVQDTWLRAQRKGLDGIDNPAAWLTTITTRVCLNLIRARAARREDDDEAFAMLVDDANDPVHEAVLADAVGLAMLVVLDTLTPSERVALVLHDMFSMPFEDIAEIIDKSPYATRQLASRARRRVRNLDVRRDAGDVSRRAVVEAFFGAARRGDLLALIEVLHPDVVLNVNVGMPQAVTVSGAQQVAGRAAMFANPAATVVPVEVEGEIGVLVSVDGRPSALMVFTVRDGAVVAIDSITDPERLLDLLD